MSEFEAHGDGCQCLCIFYQYLTDDATHIPATVASISLHISSSKSPDQDGAPPALLLAGRLPGLGRRPPCILPHRSLLQVIIRAVNEQSLSFSLPGEGPYLPLLGLLVVKSTF